MAEKTLTYEEYEDVRDSGDYKTIEGPDVVDERRWVNGYESILLHKATGKHFILLAYRGNNEVSNDGFSYREYPATLTEAEPYQEMVTKYRPLTEVAG